MKFLIQANQKISKNSKQVANIEAQNDHCFYNILNPSNKIQCDICKRDISKYTKILGSNLDYCVACFSNLGKYPNNYHVVNKIDYPLFDADWTAEEELLLFEGLQKHGFGNWSEIADFICTNKTREDVQQHYTTVYINASNSIPQKQQILTIRDKFNRLVIKKTKQPVISRRSTKPTTKNAVVSNQQFQRGSLTVNNQITTSLKTGTNPAQIVGYLPKRGDFEVQYDNDAELLLAEMQFNDDDTEQQKEMKFRLMDIYNHKLKERIRRKEFVISRKLLDIKQQTRLDKARTKQQKQIYTMMKVFARFSTPQEHEKLVTGIIRQKQIRQRIQELKELRKKGFHTLAEVEEQLQNKRYKDDKKKKVDIDYYHSHYNDKNTRRSRKDMPIQKSQKRTPYISQEEEQICHKFNMTFKQYMMIKQTIIRQSVKQGILQRNQTSKIFKIDRHIFDGIFDFLVEKEDIIGN